MTDKCLLNSPRFSTDLSAVVHPLNGQLCVAREAKVSPTPPRTMNFDEPASMTSQKPLQIKTFLLIAIMVIAGPLGNVLLSKGMKQAGNLSFWPLAEAPHTALRVLSTGSIWLGIASLLTFFLANILVLSWADYSYVQPASSVGYGVAALLGYLMLGEPVSPLRWAGIAIICLGVFVVGQTSPQSPERSQL